MSGSATNKQGSKRANSTIDTANALSSQYGARAGGLFSTLEPQLEAEAKAPSGYGASGLAAMNTAAGESAAGETAGRVGALRRAAARTRNAGGYAAAEDEAAREGGRTASTAALNVAARNEDVKQQQQQAGLRGLEGLYGTDVGANLNALGLVPGLINAQTGALKRQGNTFGDILGYAQQGLNNAATVAAAG